MTTSSAAENRTEDHAGHEHAGHHRAADPAGFFEPASWEERYAGDGSHWSGSPNPQLVAEASALTPGTALDIGCGEGADVIWLARHGWTATGLDFSANGLARAARHAAAAGVGDRVSWQQADARTFTADGPGVDLVTSHYLHPSAGRMPEVIERLARAVAPGGHLLVVGHAPTADHPAPTGAHERAMFRAEELLDAVPEDFAVIVAEQRPRTSVREGRTITMEDSVLLLRREA
ncbi:cyclopropane-fatty-acyl-phospholipid synthase family protein [Brachybacterium sp. YJGR34]|uniref:SAM-dependent methyltransferase n=1 Tax=Brachybacterium sp. YJGR34 TaxID=2059911 RepID=UPI000E0B81CA|nr:class I SAM-dependent methyltransferase [Brachybacterium sp. YJGR34]